MTMTIFTFCAVDVSMAGSPGIIPAMRFSSVTSESKTPSGSNGQTTASCAAGQRFCRVVTDTAVYVSFASSPDATTAATRIYMPANTVEYFAVNVGDKGAVVTA